MSTPNPYASPAPPPVVTSRTARLPWWFWVLCLVAMAMGGLGALPATLVLYRTVAGPQGPQGHRAEEWEEVGREFDARWVLPALVFCLFHLAVWLTLAGGVVLSLRRHGQGRKILAVGCWTGVFCQFASVLFLGALLQDFIAHSWDVEGPRTAAQNAEDFWRGMPPVFAWSIFVSAGLAFVGALLHRVSVRKLFEELPKNGGPSDEL